MLTRMYSLIIALHPKPFRQRYGAEMQWIFEQQPGTHQRLRLVADGFASVLRQHVLRGEDNAPAETPMFATVSGDHPGSAMLWHGTVATVLVWSGLSIAIGTGTVRAIGNWHFPRVPAEPRCADSLFRSIDRNGDGTITPEELALASRELARSGAVLTRPAP